MPSSIVSKYRRKAEDMHDTARRTADLAIRYTALDAARRYTDLANRLEFPPSEPQAGETA